MFNITLQVISLKLSSFSALKTFLETKFSFMMIMKVDIVHSSMFKMRHCGRFFSKFSILCDKMNPSLKDGGGIKMLSECECCQSDLLQ